MPSARSGSALDYLNFFIADVQTGFGPFVAVYLVAHAWTQVEIGFALSIGTVVAMVSQIPAGALVDALRRKRAAAAFGIAAVSGSALLLATLPHTLPVYIAEVLHGFASCIISPAVAAISLRLVGHAALGERLGRNARFASIGNGIAAAVLGAAGSYISDSAVFWITAALGIPALISLSMIQPAEVNVRTETRRAIEWAGVRDLVRDRRLLIFMGCAALFHLSNAAMLPLAGGEATKEAGAFANLIIAACIVAPQAVMALMSPWVGRVAQERGRRFALVIGWASLPVRGLLLALLPSPYMLIVIQTLSGVSAAVFGVMLPLIAADITRGSGRLNLCMGVMGLAVFVGASLSTALAGWIADAFSEQTAFLALALAGAIGTAMVGLVMPETREIPAAIPSPAGGRTR